MQSNATIFRPSVRRYSRNHKVGTRHDELKLQIVLIPKTGVCRDFCGAQAQVDASPPEVGPAMLVLCTRPWPLRGAESFRPYIGHLANAALQGLPAG